MCVPGRGKEEASKQAANIRFESVGKTRMMKRKGIGKLGCLFTPGAELLIVFSFNPSV